MARPYLRGEDRRRQIVEVALKLVSEHGVKGATLNQIAKGVGVTTAALYSHFSNRSEILLEAQDVVFERLREIHRSANNPNALERLREIGLQHTRMVSSTGGFASALVEFIAAPPDEGLREAFGAQELVLVEDLAEIVREGQVQGTIREDVEPDAVAWALVARDWGEDVSYLIGLADHWMGPRSERMLNDMLRDIRTPEA